MKEKKDISYLKVQETLDVFNEAVFYIVVAPTIKDAIEADPFMRKIWGDREIPGSHVAAMVKEYRNTQTGEIFMYMVLSDDCQGDIVAHESFHMAYSFMEMVGVALGRDSEEVFAYTLQAIYKKVEKVFKRYYKKFKKEDFEGKS